MKKYRVSVLFILAIICIFIWGLLIIRCEILTIKYGNEFRDSWKQGTMLIDPAYWKVLDYSESSASVYFVSPNGKGGTVLLFEKIESEWTLSGWGPYWSKSGSADDIIWPYIR